MHGKIILLSIERRLELTILKKLETFLMKKENLEENGSNLDLHKIKISSTTPLKGSKEKSDKLKMNQLAII